MPRVCTICTHAERTAIDKLLVEGTAFPAIAAKYCVSTDAVGRHKAGHLSQALVRAADAQLVTEADNLLDKINALEKQAELIGRKAERRGDLRTALAAIREQMRIAELLAKLRGELNAEAQAQVNGLVRSQGIPLEQAFPHWPFLKEVGEKVKRQLIEESEQRAQVLIDAANARSIFDES